MDKKAQVVAALRAFIGQRPGLEFGNYGDVVSYRAECRQIARDKREALELLRAVEWRESITAERIIDAAKGAYSGRLTIETRDNGAVSVDYCTGQYFPTEYRKAACAVLASALWDWTRDECMPAPEYRKYGDADNLPMQTVAVYGPKKERAGDWLREHFKKEFGRSIAQRWFR